MAENRTLIHPSGNLYRDLLLALHRPPAPAFPAGAGYDSTLAAAVRTDRFGGEHAEHGLLGLLYATAAPTTNAGFQLGPRLAPPSLAAGTGDLLEDCDLFFDSKSRLGKRYLQFVINIPAPGRTGLATAAKAE